MIPNNSHAQVPGTSEVPGTLFCGDVFRLCNKGKMAQPRSTSGFTVIVEGWVERIM
jgi:hypothetical protein